jgi:hypothetical protein
MAFYGKPLAKTIGRLTALASQGTNSIYVETTAITSWSVGD